MRGTRYRLAPRWCSFSGNIKLTVESLKELLPDIKPNKRGQPPKHPIKDYMIIIVIKESKKSSLRYAETDWSEVICGERVDHSVIAYWEKHIPNEAINNAVRLIGSKLEGLLGYKFSVIDATSFSDWHMGSTSFHLLNRIHDDTVYPVSMSIDTLDPVPNTRETIIPGNGEFMGDAWYDVNKVFRIIYEYGYIPLARPNKNRGKGYWRRKARKVYNMEWRRYRQRGTGESVFGSLTNAFGDRLNTRTKETTYIRSCARVIAYHVKIYIGAVYNGYTVISVIWMNS